MSVGAPSVATRPRSRRPQTARQRRTQLLNRVIAFVLLADVVVLLTIEINGADRPEVTTASGAGVSGALVQQDLDRLKNQVPVTTEPPRIGQRSQTIGGSQLTLYSFQLPATGLASGASPRPGNVFAAADVEGCSGPTVRGGAAKIDAQRFRFELSDGTKIPAGAPIKTPALSAVAVPAGKCTRGWVTFEVPEGKRNGFLVYSGSSEIRWTVP